MAALSSDGAAAPSAGSGGPVLALTFDDGPEPGRDDEILRLLARHGAVATFFVIGATAAAHLELVGRMVAAGCEIGNHSWTHVSLLGLGAELQREEVRRTNELLAGVGIRPRWFRPPFGHTDARIEAIAREEGLETVLWSLDSRDWARQSPEEIARRVIAGLAPGAVILLHSFAASSLAALPRILDHATSLGYRCVTLSESRRLEASPAALRPPS